MVKVFLASNDTYGKSAEEYKSMSSDVQHSFWESDVLEYQEKVVVACVIPMLTYMRIYVHDSEKPSLTCKVLQMCIYMLHVCSQYMYIVIANMLHYVH